MTAYLEIEDAPRLLTVTDSTPATSDCSPQRWRPATTVMGVGAYPELAMKAAALLESVARFHSLNDGNKRAAWTLVVLLLWINGYRHNFGTDKGFNLVVGVAAGDIDLQGSAVLIEKHLIRR